MCSALGGSTMECRVGRQPHKTSHFHPQHRHPPFGVTLPRKAWVWLNHLHTSFGRFHSCWYKWGMASSSACECWAEEQTIDHVALQCPIHRSLMECMAWRFWTMRQSNGCSTPALRSSAANQWLEELAQKKKKRKFEYVIYICIVWKSLVCKSACAHNNWLQSVAIERQKCWKPWKNIIVDTEQAVDASKVHCPFTTLCQRNPINTPSSKRVLSKVDWQNIA